jgi:hypothetical protein
MIDAKLRAVNLSNNGFYSIRLNASSTINVAGPSQSENRETTEGSYDGSCFSGFFSDSVVLGETVVRREIRRSILSRRCFLSCVD